MVHRHKLYGGPKINEKIVKTSSPPPQKKKKNKNKNNNNKNHFLGSRKWLNAV